MYNILRHYGWPQNSAVLMPAYIAAGVIEPIRQLGLTVHFYNTGLDLLLDEKTLLAKLDSTPNLRGVVVLHPMGRLQAIQRLAESCRGRQIILIEDCAQGLFTQYPNGDPIGSQGDIALFSLPKILGILDGALALIRKEPKEKDLAIKRGSFRTSLALWWYKAHLITNRRLHHCRPPNLAHWLLTLSEFFYNRYYALVRSDFRPIGPSESTTEAIRHLDVNRVIEQRRKNVAYLYATLKTKFLQFVYSTDQPGWVPLAVPAFVIGTSRQSAQEKAQRGGVLLASLLDHWDFLPKERRDEFAGEQFYLDHHVLIPINEHLDDDRMREVVEVLNGL